MHPELAQFLIIAVWIALFVYGNYRVHFRPTTLSSLGQKVVVYTNVLVFCFAVDFRLYTLRLPNAALICAFSLVLPWLAEKIPMLREREDESANPESAPL